MLILDTSAWIEFFDGAESGEIVRDVLKRCACYTSMVTIAEVTNAALRKNMDSHALIDIIQKSSSILVIDQGIAALAGRLNSERKKSNSKWGMMDSFVLATALAYGLEILTKDNDFKDIECAKML